jgi:cytochrome c oxidase subunit 2
MRIIALCALALLALAGCASASAGLADLPEGNAERGATLFTQSINGAPACSSCHTLDGTVLVGPSLQGFRDAADTRQNEMSAVEYSYASIVQPASDLVNGFRNSMYNQYAQRLSPQDIADLIAYLLSL